MKYATDKNYFEKILTYGWMLIPLLKDKQQLTTQLFVFVQLINSENVFLVWES